MPFACAFSLEVWGRGWASRFERQGLSAVQRDISHAGKTLNPLRLVELVAQSARGARWPYAETSGRAMVFDGCG